MKTTTIILMMLLALPCMAQQQYSINASKSKIPLETGHFKMGNPGPKGKEIEVNSQYMTIAGKPVLPVMGEVHFSRIKPEHWEDCILKMKACGINVISTYLFWDQHEEIEGQFDWTKEKDIRTFIKLCQKHNMYAYPRIGPWSHGEARNGGTPDWILRKKYIKDRSNDVVYQNYVTRYFHEIGKQLEDLYYKDGGNIIGIQLENEYWYAKEGEPHMTWLKKTAIEAGMDVPMYTVTGWGDGSVPPLEVLPLWGGYADEPWIESVKKHILTYNFVFDSFRDNEHIGNDQIQRKEAYMTYERYPYFTCEMGVGIQNTYHRRLKIGDRDGLGMLVTKLGSGSNLLGYYMFAGGTNPRGELYGTEEEQDETGYWSRVPAKSYDFQAAIKESGELAPSYNEVKKLHYFTNYFGETLAPMSSTLSKTPEEELQLAVRSDATSGYLFGTNYCRYVPKPIRKNVQFSIQLEKESIRFPQKGVDIPDSTFFIWPMNFKIGAGILKYATAQPLCKVENTFVFFQNKTIRPEFAFDNSTINEVKFEKGKVSKNGTMTIVSDIQPGKNSFIHLTLKDGSNYNILVLSEQEATDSWLLEQNGKPEFYISKASMYVNSDELYAFSTDTEIKVSHLQQDAFAEKTFSAQPKANNVKLTPHPLFADAQWLETANFKDIADNMQRYHRFFFKEFSLDNPSAFRKATLYIYPESSCLLNTNNKWVRQEIKPNQVNAIDITGYVEKGENMLFVDFPYLEGKAKFTARVMVEYNNYDRIEFSTDTSWLTTDMYTNPSPTRPYNRPGKPVVVPTPELAKTLNHPSFGEWDIKVPYNSFGQLSSLYAHLNYIGDRAELYDGHILCGDSFNDNTPWQIGLQRINAPVEGKNLRVVIYPLSKETKVFFDIMPNPTDYGKTGITKFEVKQENQFKLKTKN